MGKRDVTRGENRKQRKDECAGIKGTVFESKRRNQERLKFRTEMHVN